MKNIFVILIITLLISGISAQKAIIKFEKKFHNFGSFKEEEGVKVYTFKFKNIGNAALNITNVKSSCGCTTPSYTKEPIGAGKSGELKVSFDPKDRPGPFDKTITINSNSTTPVIELKIKGNVTARIKTETDLYPIKMLGLRLSDKNLIFTKVKINSIKKSSINIKNTSNKNITISFISVPTHLKLQVEPKVLKPNQTGKIVATYNGKQKNKYGFLVDRIKLKINGVTNKDTKLSVKATVVEDFSKLTTTQIANAPKATFSSKLHHFGNVKSGDVIKHSFKLTNNGKSNLIIRRIVDTRLCKVSKPAKTTLKPGESVNLNVIFNTNGKKGKQYKRITVITNDPKHSNTTLKVKGVIK